MRTLLLTTLLLSISLSLSAQNLAADIEKQYSLLDKDEYLKVLVENYRIQRQNFHYNESKQHEKFCQEHGLALTERDTSGWVDKETEEFAQIIKQANPYFVLKLNYGENGFEVDSSNLNFNILWFGKKNPIKLIYIKKGVIFVFGKIYPSLMDTHVNNAHKALRKMKKARPQHLLFSDVHQGWISYIDGKLFACDIYDLKIEELDDYVKTNNRIFSNINKYINDNEDIYRLFLDKPND